MTAPRRLSWDEAYRLVVHEGASYADAADATGIPISTIQKRAASEEWRNQRTTTMSYGSQVELAKSRSLQNLLDGMSAEPSLSADDLVKLASIWRGIESAYPTHRYQPAEEDPEAKLRIAMEVMEFFWAYFAEVDTNLLAALRGHALTIAERLEARYAAAA